MRRHAKAVLGVVLSILLLWWALRGVSPAEVARELRGADPVLLALSILILLAGLAVRAIRWGVLLLPAGAAVPFRARFATIIIGFAANNLLPARVGEFARALSLSRLTTVSTGTAIATLVVERLFDGIVLVALLFASMAAPSFPAGGDVAGLDPRVAARAIALAMGLLGATLFAMVLAPRLAVIAVEALASRTLPARLRNRLVRAVESFLDGLLVLRHGRLFVVSALLAVGQWLFTALSFLLAFRAFDIDAVPFSGAIFLQSLVSLAAAIPSSPGFFGPFEAAAKLGLGLWGIPGEKAVSFAVGYHLGGFLPVTLMGIYYVWRLGLSWREVQHSDEAVTTPPPPRDVSRPRVPERT